MLSIVASSRAPSVRALAAQTRLFTGRVRKEETSANAVKLSAMMEKPGAPREKEAAETAEGIQSHDVCSTNADHHDEELKKAEKNIGKKN